MPFRIGVVGAGTMGGTIARTLAEAGCDVVLQTRRPEAGAVLARGFLRRTRRQQTPIQGSFSVTGQFEGFGNCDLVIEAVAETAETKVSVLSKLEGVIASETLLATNTSSLPIAQLGSALERPERFLGVHFFHPVRVVKLVEVAAGGSTQPAAVERAVEILVAAGRAPWRVADRPGFIVNRILFPALHEALRMLDEGVASAEQIDAASSGLGIAMGPCATLDLLGLDVLLAMCRNFENNLGSSHRAPALLEALVQSGRLGRKSGRGIYRYTGGMAEVDSELAALCRAESGCAPTRFDVDRLRFGMLREALVCVEEGLAPADEIEAALCQVLGAERGPIAHASALGGESTLARFDALAAEFGRRFGLSDALRRGLASGTLVPAGVGVAA